MRIGQPSSDAMTKDYYLILGVAADATPDEIKAAFRRRALELHPDVSGLPSEPFLELQEAYAVLANPERRRRYDRQFVAVIPASRPRRTADRRSAAILVAARSDRVGSMLPERRSESPFGNRIQWEKVPNNDWNHRSFHVLRPGWRRSNCTVTAKQSGAGVPAPVCPTDAWPGSAASARGGTRRLAAVSNDG